MDRRARFRQNLSKLYLPYYDALCAELGDKWQPYQGVRTMDEQTALYRQGREGRPGAIVTWAQAGYSAHNYGCATDWVVFQDGKPIWDATDKDWTEYQHAIEKVGLRWGADWDNDGHIDADRRKLDRPHNELLIACSWKHVGLVFSKTGRRAADEHIEKNLVK